MAIEVPGYRAAGIACGIKPSGKADLALIVSDRPAHAAAVFTTSHFPGAPVVVSRAHLRGGCARGVVVNSGISNVANGARGLRDAREMAALLAGEIGARSREIQVASTGVIGRTLPMQRLREGIPRAVAALSPRGFERAAEAILTTDTVAKLVHRRGRGFALAGFAKGAGMIMPRMATMLAYLVTDLAVEPALLRRALRASVDATFNALTIDGETSTSDTLLVLANGAAGNTPIRVGSARARDFERLLLDASAELCERLARDGEGVTKLATVSVRGARSDADADRVARSVANSALVKTALFGGDPNWGRVVQAVGAAGVALAPARVGVRIGGVELLRGGEPAGGRTALKRAERAMKAKRVEIEVTLGRGPGRARILTTDLSYEYVRVNAEYTT
ncbi:MAG: bifunctional glutamate N-acetyltransferase/amino-acid acetyltransferase ArgJ [Myxococcota bacterium]